ncbi:MAG: hypothetical protein ACREC0_00495 [Methylocella sp.]
MYDCIKDFASPVATLIAAIVASVITYTFAQAQTRLAQSQRDIALDKLKFGLFQKRYEIYEVTKELLEYVPFINSLENLDASKVRSMYIKLDEARFCFPKVICGALDKIHAKCEAFFTHLGERDQIVTDDHEKWTRSAETLAADQSALRAIYASLPQIFETALKFEQLTNHEELRA